MNVWPTVALGDIVQFKYGRALKAEDRVPGPFNVMGSNGVVGQHNSAFTAGPSIVVGRKGSVGALTYSDGPCWPIDTAYYIDASTTEQNPRWLYWALGQLRLNEMNKAAAVPGLNRDDAYRATLQLPPLPEQHRIASILDKADSLRKPRRRALERIHDFRGGFLDSALSGDWPNRALGDLFDVTGGKRLPKGAPYADLPTKQPYLRVSDMENGSFRTQDLKYLTTEVHDQVNRYVVTSSDLVMSIAGSIGLVSKVPEQLAGANLTENAARLRPKDPGTTLPAFFQAQLSSAAVQSQIKMATGQVTIGKLALFRIEKLRVLVPPITQQRDFEIKAESVEYLQSIQIAHLALLNELFASLQHRAFTGQL